MISQGGVNAYNNTTLDDLQGSQGVTQYDEGGIYLPFNGLIIQAGKLTVPNGTTTFAFNGRFEKEIITLHVTATLAGTTVGAIPVDLYTFNIHNDGSSQDVYWLAIGT